MNTQHKEHLLKFLPSAGYSLLCGSITGLVIFLFKFAAKKAELFSEAFYSKAKDSVLLLFLLFAVLVLLAFIMSKLHAAVPECKGGGIPRSEGILRGILPFRWLRTLLGTFFGSMLSFVAGVPVGSEGPAVLIGTSIGKMTTHGLKKQEELDRYIMTGGAGAGFAVATGAPLSGILFTLEEIHKFFSPLLVLNVALSVLSATFFNQILCRQFQINPALFELEPVAAFDFTELGYLLLLAAFIAVAVAVFDGSILFFRSLTAKWKTNTIPIKLILVFCLTGLLGLYCSEGIYSGHHLIEHVLTTAMPFSLLFVLFLIRMILMLFVTDSGATGGIFIPTLAIGVLAAAIITRFLLLLGMPAEFSATVIFLGMCAFIGGTLRAPLTASILFLELTGQFTNLFYVAFVVFIVSFITELFGLMPFYDKALEEMVEAKEKNSNAE